MTRIARTALSLLASVAMLTPNVAMAQEANPAPASQFTHNEIMECYKASAIYFVLSDDLDHELTDQSAQQVQFWREQMGEDLSPYRAELDVFEAQLAADVKEPIDDNGDNLAAKDLAMWMSTFNACTDKWNSANAAVVRKLDSPMPPATSFTAEESKECMFNTFPFLMVAARDPDADLEGLAESAKFWADEADKFGDISAEEENAMMARVDTLTAASLAAKSDEQTAAFLAPYQDGFTACEAKRAAATGA